MVDWTVLVAKALHVLLAATWVGASVFNVFLIQPLLAHASAPTRREFAGRLFPAAFRFGNIVGGLTLATGLLLVTVLPSGWDAVKTTAWGRVVIFALIATILVLYLLNFAVRPTAKVLAKVMAEMAPDEPPPANIRFLQARLRFASFLVVGLQVLVLLLMVYADQLGAPV